ncbi:MAG: hypothetical protein HUJ68_10550 [Clostridia bacterium]|nr:hypothetical protein [Clostridia bacterium]
MIPIDPGFENEFPLDIKYLSEKGLHKFLVSNNVGLSKDDPKQLKEELINSLLNAIFYSDNVRIMKEGGQLFYNISDICKNFLDIDVSNIKIPIFDTYYDPSKFSPSFEE